MFTKNGPAKIQFYKMLNLKHKKNTFISNVHIKPRKIIYK